MKQCKECWTLSPDNTIYCYICGTKFNDSERSAVDNATTVELQSTEQKSYNKSILEETKADIGDGMLLFNGVYQFKYPEYSSYLRFFADGKVVEVSSTGTPEQVAQWLNHDYESNGFYTVESDVVRFTITSSSGQVSYSEKIHEEDIDIDLISHINGYNASGLRYCFCHLL